MPNYTTPGVYFLENDFSEYAPSVNSSVAAVIGYASMGPENKATLITSAKQFVDTFGRPDTVLNGEHAILGTLEILKKTNNVYFVRAVAGTPEKAKANVKIGFCPAASITAPQGYASMHLLVSVYQVHDSEGAETLVDELRFVVPKGASSEENWLDSLVTEYSKISTNNTPITISKETIGSELLGLITSRHAGGLTGMAIYAVSSFTSDFDTDADGLIDYNDANIAILRSFTYIGDLSTAASVVVCNGGEAAALNWEVSPFYSGAGYNTSTLEGGKETGLKVDINPTSNAGSDVVLYRDAALVEAHAISTGGTKHPFWLTKIIGDNKDESRSGLVQAELAGDQLPLIELDSYGDWYRQLSTTKDLSVYWGGVDEGDLKSDANPRCMKLVPGTYDFIDGSNGDSSDENEMSSAFIGIEALKTGINAFDDDSLNISMACAPGNTTDEVQNALATLAEDSQNFLAVLSVPKGLKPQEAIQWHNGEGTYGRSTPLNTSYAAIYYPHLQVFNPYTGSTFYASPDVYAMATMAHTDSVSETWFAPAGLVRARLTSPLDTEVILNAGDRTALYGGGNVVNPIAKFNPDGIVIYGQRTAQRTPSSLDRVNIRRMMILIRKMVLGATRQFVFEPNDPLTWNRITGVLNPMFDDISRRRGITEFRVICDSSTNTPIRIDRNELWCQVRIKPTKTAEIIVFEVNLTNQSASV